MCIRDRARANRDVHAKFLLRNGADRIVYPEKEMAQRLAVKYGNDNIFDYIEPVSYTHLFRTGIYF